MAQDHMYGEQQSKYLNTECATLKTKFFTATQQCLLNKENQCLKVGKMWDMLLV